MSIAAGARDRRPATCLVAGCSSGETQPCIQGIRNPIAIEVGGPAMDVAARTKVNFSCRNEVAQSSPSFGRFASEGAKLTVGFTPEVEQAVAIQIGSACAAQYQGPVQLSTGRRLQDIN